MAISKELKERWIARLESPDAKWAKGALLDLNTGGMCCLGHLADIQGHLDKETAHFIPPCDDGGAWFEEALCVLSTHDGLDDDGDPNIVTVAFYGLDHKTQNDLAAANDGNGHFPLDMIRALPVSDEEAPA
jgi:hypothetical protein